MMTTIVKYMQVPEKLAFLVVDEEGLPIDKTLARSIARNYIDMSTSKIIWEGNRQDGNLVVFINKRYRFSICFVLASYDLTWGGFLEYSIDEFHHLLYSGNALVEDALEFVDTEYPRFCAAVAAQDMQDGSISRQ